MLTNGGYSSHAIFLLRLIFGFIFIYHGALKLKASKSTTFFKGLGVVECVAGLAIIVGFYTDIAAIATAVVMLGAIYHKIFLWKVPFMAQKATGWELDLILLGVALVLIFLGPGVFSYDYLFSGWWP